MNRVFSRGGIVGGAPTLGVSFALLIIGLCASPVAYAVEQPRIAPEIVRLPVVEADGLRFKRLSTADGLSQTRVAQIVQDDRGFMWFGTQYGLNRYDGYEFKLFVHQPGKQNSLAGAFIYSLFKDRDGILWIGCNQILDRFDPHTETFTHFRVETDRREKLGGSVVHISQDRRGFLWLATGTGLHRLDPKTGALKHFRHAPEKPASLSTNDVKWSGEDREGDLWVGTTDGLDQLDRENGVVKLHIPIRDGVQNSFYEDRQGVFWIFHASGNGLARYDRAANTVTQYSFYGSDPASDALTGVMGMLDDREGNLWIGSPGIGLLRFDRANQRFLHYRHRGQDEYSISENKVIALFEDREGNIWTGLHSVGPNHFSRKGIQFTAFKHEPDNPNSLSVNFVNAIYEDANGILWIGNDDGLNRIDRQTGHRTFTTAGLGTKPMIITITEDANGIIWFGTYGHGVTRYDPSNGRYKTYRHNPNDPHSLSNDQVHRVFVDHAQRLWIGTGDGLNLFDPATERFQVYKVESDSRLSQSYVAIAEDAAGTLWLGTSHSGLHHFDPATGRFTVYNADTAEDEGLRDDTVPMVHVSSKLVWIGTQNGLNSFDPKTGKFQAYDVRDGLPANTIACILDDAKGNLWLSTNRGLSRFNPATGAFSNYAAIDGLPGDDLTGWSTCFKSRRGEMFFGGFPGAVAFYPDQLQDTFYRPPVVLTDFQLYGASVAIGPDEPLHKSIAYTDQLTLQHDQNSFAVAFAGLRYLSPDTNRYRYRLDGLDRQWYESSSKIRRATYTALSPGFYRFHVQSASGRGPWNEPGVTLRIWIRPPWWAMWWFRALYVSLLALAVWWAYRIRLRQISRRLMLQMEARANERLRIARDLHDTVLQGLVSASMQLSVANDQLPAESPSKSLVARVSELLQQMIDEGRNTVRGLRMGPIEADDLEQALSAVPRDLGIAGESKLRIIVEGKRRPLKPVARNEAYWIGREALANAFRHAQAGSIEMRLEYSRHRFRMSVRDDGRGFNPTLLRSGRDNHWGLSGMSERSERMGAKLTVSSAEGAGTEVELTMPAHLAFASERAGRRRERSLS